MDDDCRAALDRLHLYLDGECDASLETTIRHHLSDCSPCLDRVEFERELRVIVARKCRDAAPDGLLDRVIERLRP